MSLSEQSKPRCQRPPTSSLQISCHHPPGQTRTPLSCFLSSLPFPPSSLPTMCPEQTFKNENRSWLRLTKTPLRLCIRLTINTRKWTAGLPLVLLTSPALHAPLSLSSSYSSPSGLHLLPQILHTSSPLPGGEHTHSAPSLWSMHTPSNLQI